MRTSFVAPLAVLAMLTSVSASALPGTADLSVLAPVKCSAGDVTPDGRVFPEPTLSATFLTFADFECGVELLEETHADLIDIASLGESKGGAPVYDIVVTDESVPEEDKRHMLILSSIHGNEHAGREGAVRVIEDMVDQRNEQDFIASTLQDFVVHFVFPNPDGWINGDVSHDDGGANFSRANDGGRDLNRNFPVIGYLRASNGTLDQPEGRALDALLAAHADTEHATDSPDYRGWYLGTDNHGQGAKPVAASGLQIVGQFDFGKSELLARFADSISDNIEGVALESIEALNQATGGAVQPYEWGTLYDILGYSAAGSGIDYYNSPGIVEGTGFATEMTASNLPFSNIATHPGLVNQMWVDTVRAINYAMFRTAVDPVEFTFPVAGRAAYVMDHVSTSSTDFNGFGDDFGTSYDAALAMGSVPANFTGDDAVEDFQFVDYDVSRMQFFSDLNDFADNDLDAVRADFVLAGLTDLSVYDSLVLADEVMPGASDLGAWVAALDTFVRGGGNLIVTDGAAPVLADLVAGIAPADVTVRKANVGYVDFTGDSALNANLRGVASQTYDVVPIGYPDNANAAPNWTVATAAWAAAGGTTAGTNGTGRTIYGQLPLGEGNLVFLGALLPEPTEAFFHPYGLQNYAVTYTGYTLLENMLGLAGS